jgi:hypothetical protein
MSELSRDAASLVERARSGDAPSAEDRARMREKLTKELGAAAFAGVALGGAAASSLGGSAAASTGANSGAGNGLTGAVVHKSTWFGMAKLALAALVTASLGVGGFFLFSSAREARTPEHPNTQVTQEVQAPETPAIEAPALAAPAQSPSPPSAPQVEAPVQAPKRVPKVRSPRGEPRALAAVPQAPDALTLQEEMTLLSRAQVALRQGHAERALAVLREHETRFPAGALREERLGLQAMAACAQGEDGARVVRDFTALAPHSPLLSRVREACATK